MDQVFDSGSLEDLRHYTLMTLRTIVECYYPAVFPTVGFQGTLGSHNPVGPAPSVEIYDYLTQSLHPMVEASTQAPDSSLEVVSANSKSQNQQRCQAAMRQTLMSVSDVIPDTV